MGQRKGKGTGASEGQLSLLTARTEEGVSTRLKAMPAGWALTPRMRDLAAAVGMQDRAEQDHEFAACRAHHAAKGSRFTEAGWTWATWNTWVQTWRRMRDGRRRPAAAPAPRAAAVAARHTDLDAGVCVAGEED